MSILLILALSHSRHRGFDGSLWLIAFRFFLLVLNNAKHDETSNPSRVSELNGHSQNFRLNDPDASIDDACLFWCICLQIFVQQLRDVHSWSLALSLLLLLLNSSIFSCFYFCSSLFGFVRCFNFCERRLDFQIKIDRFTPNTHVATDQLYFSWRWIPIEIDQPTSKELLFTSKRKIIFNRSWTTSWPLSIWWKSKTHRQRRSKSNYLDC